MRATPRRRHEIKMSTSAETLNNVERTEAGVVVEVQVIKRGSISNL